MFRPTLATRAKKYDQPSHVVHQLSLHPAGPGRPRWASAGLKNEAISARAYVLYCSALLTAVNYT